MVVSCNLSSTYFSSISTACMAFCLCSMLHKLDSKCTVEEFIPAVASLRHVLFWCRAHGRSSFARLDCRYDLSADSLRVNAMAMIAVVACFGLFARETKHIRVRAEQERRAAMAGN